MKQMRKIILFATFALWVNAITAQKSEVKVWAVKLDHPESSPLFEVKMAPTDAKSAWNNYIYIQPQTQFQTIEGIGGAFNENGGEALLSLPKEKQQEVMSHLFAANKAGFTFCRTAIGSSDFGLDAYSYSELADDYEMKHFSIDRDKKYVLPYIKSAFAINPGLTLFGSPWSPPGWTKESGYMEGLKEPNNKLKQDAKTLSAYARYFVKYVQAYEQEGVRIDRICIQNENDANTKYPSCTFPAKEMTRFANEYMVPAFKKNKIKTSIYVGTFRAAEKMDIMDFAECTKTKGIEGIGLQYTNTSIIADARVLMPDMKMFHTEGHCYNGENSVEQASHRLEEVAGYINNGCSAYTYWNMILNETTKSGWDWPQNSLINIDRSTGEVRYNPDYNAMYIISKFIKPGDVRVASFNRGHYPMITVKSPDGTIKVLIQNTNPEDKVFEISMNDQKYKLNVPANTITAITIK